MPEWKRQALTVKEEEKSKETLRDKLKIKAKLKFNKTEFA